MNGLRAPRKFFEHRDGIAVSGQAVADIHLHVDLGLRAAEEKLPGETAIDLGKIERVRMIAHLHFVRPALCRSVVQQHSQISDRIR